jgi:hypothetical protein
MLVYHSDLQRSDSGTSETRIISQVPFAFYHLLNVMAIGYLLILAYTQVRARQGFLRGVFKPDHVPAV